MSFIVHQQLSHYFLRDIITFRRWGPFLANGITILSSHQGISMVQWSSVIRFINLFLINGIVRLLKM